MHKIMLVCLGLTAGLPAAAADPHFPAQSERSFREACSEYSEAGMHDCLTKQAQESNRALAQAKQDVYAALNRWDEDPKYVKLAAARFGASQKAFAQYRQAQCEFAASLGGGAIGNALDMQRLACVAEFNGRRAEQLRDAVAGLPVK